MRASDTAHRISHARKAVASGWIGSALEDYDFFIYATAASLVFPQVFFPSGDPQVAIVASLATYGVGYVARPVGAFVLGHWGDTYGRKNVLVVCMFLMGVSTMGVGLLPTYEQVGMLAPVLLVVLRLIQGFAVAGEISGASSMILEHAPFGRRGFYASFTLQGVQAGQLLAAAVFLPLARYMPDDTFLSWGWRVPFLLSFVRDRRGLRHPPPGCRKRRLFAEQQRRRGAERADHPRLHRQLAGHAARRVHGADECHPGRRDDLWSGLRGAAGVTASACGKTSTSGSRSLATARRSRHSVRRQLSDQDWTPAADHCRRARSGMLSFAYLYAISIRNVPLAIVVSLLMWGVVYQGYNAVFPSFYPELFPTRMRVSAMAVGQNVGTMVTAMLPALFAAVAPPGSSHIPWTIGAITFAVTVIASLAAWSARETYRVPLHDLDNPDAVPLDEREYMRLRGEVTPRELGRDVRPTEGA